MSKRLNGDQRKRIITVAAVGLALRENLAAVTHQSVADECRMETSPATVRYYFKTIGDLQRAVIEEHSTSENLKKQAQELGLI